MVLATCTSGTLLLLETTAKNASLGLILQVWLDNYRLVAQLLLGSI